VCLTSYLLRGHFIFSPSDNNSDNEEENSEEDEDEDEDKDEEIEESKSMKRSPGKTAGKASASSTKSSSVGELFDSFSGLDSGKKRESASPFSIGVKDARFIKGSFEEGGKTFIEIDLLVPGTTKKEHIHARLNLDKNGLNTSRKLEINRMTCAFFFESKRMRKSMGRDFHINDSRFIAHQKTVRAFRVSTTVTNGMVMAIENELQIVVLPEACQNPVVLQSYDEVPTGLTVTSKVMYEGKPIIIEAPQYHTLITYRMMTQVQPMENIKKISKKVLHMDINNMDDSSSDDDEEDIDIDMGTL